MIPVQGPTTKCPLTFTFPSSMLAFSHPHLPDRSQHTYDPSVKVRVGRHLEAGVRHQEAGDVGEAGVDVFAYILQLLVLVLRDLGLSKHAAASVTITVTLSSGSTSGDPADSPSASSPGT